MKIVAVNHCHPDTPHVCATRFRRFAETLAAFGHQVVLLTETRTPDDPAPDNLEQRLRDHDWATPFVLACPPVGHDRLRRAREGGLSPLPGKLALASAYLRHGTVFPDWVDGCRPVFEILDTHFRPNVVWATFGNTGAWVIAQELARKTGASWVMDLKDPWDTFLPFGLRRLVARRFDDAGAATALSQGHADQIRRFFARSADVIYSGIPSDWVQVPTQPDNDTVHVTLTGSLYDAGRLGAFADGLSLVAAQTNKPVHVTYFGSDPAARAILEPLEGACSVHLPGYVDLKTLSTALRTAHINAFVANKTVLFHHKIFELLAAARPILALAPVGVEEHDIAASCGGSLEVATNGIAVANAIYNATETPSALDRDALTDFTWTAQAARLEALFEGVRS